MRRRDARQTRQPRVDGIPAAVRLLDVTETLEREENPENTALDLAGAGREFAQGHFALSTKGFQNAHGFFEHSDVVISSHKRPASISSARFLYNPILANVLTIRMLSQCLAA